MRLLQPPSQALYKLCEMRKITLSKFLNEQAPHEVEKKKDNGNKSSSQKNWKWISHSLNELFRVFRFLRDEQAD